MRVISIGTDRKVFDQDSAVRARMVEQGKAFDELHIIVYSLRKQKLEARRISDTVWIYPTNSLTKLLYAKDAVAIVEKMHKLRKFTPKETVVTAQDPFDTGIAAVRLKKRLGLRLQLQVHTDFLSPYFAGESLLNRLRVRSAKKNLNYADRIRVVSERIKRSLTTLSISETKVDVLPIFTDVKKYQSPAQFDLHTIYPEFSFLILMASRLTHEKNISSALRALKEVVKKYPKTGLVIVGEGPELESLKKQTRILNIDNHVGIEPWQNDLVSYYKTCNLFLLTSLYEGYGLTLVEAGLCGAPIVTTDVGLAGDLIKDGKTGSVCRVKDDECLVEKISEMIADNGLRQLYKTTLAEELAHAIIADIDEYMRLYRALLEKTLGTE